jgi:single-stranded-DNA-specific exonuclease
MAYKKWIIREADKDKASALSEKFNIDPFIAFLLVSRGIDDDLSASNFLSDSFELVSPFDFADMEEAIFAIGEAMDNQEKICIYGDYDCDGVTSTALLYSFLKNEGADVCYYIPDRDTEGYGLNNNAIDKIKNMGVSLVVTVDNGIASVNEAEYIYSLGMKLVVTDHHQLGETLPRAEAIVNPHRTDNNLKFKEYCGVGVAFKLASAMYDGDIDYLIDNYIDLVAIGTIADIVPLTHENRAFVKAGLNKINNNPRFAVKAFIDYNNSDKTYSSTDIAFQLCPRINAVGRLDHASKAVEFLISSNYDDASFKLEQLNIENSHRQEIERNILEDVENPSLAENRVIVISGKNYHHGVIGIVASHIVEKYSKPTFIIDIDDNGFARGSARSVEGFNIFEAISFCKDDLTKFGGHPLAAGISLDENNIDDFRKHINDFAKINYPTMPPQAITLDCKLSPFYLSIDLVDNLQSLEPYGAENPQAVFGIYKLNLVSVTPIGDGKHIRLELEKKGKKIRVVKFSTPVEEFPYKAGALLNLAVKVSKNLYKGKYYLSVQAVDIKPSNADDDKYFAEKSLYDRYLCDDYFEKSMFPSRDTCAVVYRYLKANNGYKYSFDDLYFELQGKVTYSQLKFALLAFSQTGLINISNQIEINSTNSKVDLDNAPIIKLLKGKFNFD